MFKIFLLSVALSKRGRATFSFLTCPSLTVHYEFRSLPLTFIIIPHFSSFVKNFFYFCGFVCQSSRKWRYRPLFHHKHHPTTQPAINAFLPVQYILAINHCVQMLFTSFDFYIISHYLSYVKYYFLFISKIEKFHQYIQLHL